MKARICLSVREDALKGWDLKEQGESVCLSVCVFVRQKENERERERERTLLKKE